MENKFNFKSQICTSREQSERLLALGLKKETADMVWLDHALTEDYEDWRQSPIYKDWEGWQKDGIPAWSLHRLIEIMPKTIINSPFLKRWNLHITHESVMYCNQKDTSDWLEKFSGQGMYNNIINCIECLIKEGYFNQEYLVGLTSTCSHQDIQDIVDAFIYGFVAKRVKKEE